MPPADHYGLLLARSYLRFMTPPSTYENWSRADLISRLAEYDRVHNAQPSLRAAALAESGVAPAPNTRGARARARSPPRMTPSKALREPKAFDVSRAPRRKIALRFAYAGWAYGGLAFQVAGTPLPTVEGVLFDALAHLKLIDPAAGPEGCGWERCGRTDKGVSGAGQVVSLWVRTALGGPAPAEDCAEDPADVAQPEERSDPGQEAKSSDEPLDDGLFGSMDLDTELEITTRPPPPAPTEELHYVSMLNKTLPPTIRALAWSPVAPDFSSRFACQSRHYKYFFSPAHLDVERMRKAAGYMLGEHDFRNLHRLDPAKQLTTFRRRILRADISPVDARIPWGTHVLDLEGTAFLYNQVRHIMAVLFLVGAGLEHPRVVRALLNTDPSTPKPALDDEDAPPPLVERKPEYQMADALPLMLWACNYAPGAVEWRTDGAERDAGNAETGSAELVRGLAGAVERDGVHAALDAHFLASALQHHTPLQQRLPLPPGAPLPTEMLDVPVGGGAYRHGARYVPLLNRKRLESVEVVNARWRASKGTRREARGVAEVDADANHDVGE
jgi:tRNA pseudouridine38/39 synthase